MSAQSVSEALSLLASKFERDGCPLPAIHCLQGLVGLKGLLPDFEARARAKLGRLLLYHTKNLRQSKSNLQQAVSVPACAGQSHGKRACT